MMPRQLAHASECGRRARNQDAVAAALLPGGREVVALADGMGGHAGGEVASALALEALLAALRQGVELAAAVQAANAAVYARAGAEAALHGMGTTLVAMLREGDRYSVANVGDSRAYRLTPGGIFQLTQDHSFVAEALREGKLSPREAAASPWRNALTRSLGTSAAVQVDVFGPFTIGEPHAVLLCSDGLYRGLGDEQIRQALLATPRLEAAVHALPALAMQHGSDDNISVAVVEFGRLPRAIEVGATAAVPAPRPAAPRSPGAAREGGPVHRVQPVPIPLRVEGRHRRRWRLPLAWEDLFFLLCASGLAAWLVGYVASQ